MLVYNQDECPAAKISLRKCILKSICGRFDGANESCGIEENK